MNERTGQCIRRIWPGLTVCLAVVAASCSHYGFAGDASRAQGSAEDSPTVAVWTVETPAHWSLDASRLTTRLVDALRTQGTSAGWRRNAPGSAEARATLRCRLHMPPYEARGGWTSVDATIRCQLARGETDFRTVEGRGSGSLGNTGPSVPGAVDISAETAAARAIESVALRVSSALAEPSND